ncbi:prepilin peptidase [Microbacterium karelineae]|uniref:prepilin peptidase n=1 Tax=Microbacterium karelineae TaxID=2654283 RepID=UPI0012EAB4FC|nr:A24 family peptidase [Microbacterium karelineae]
MTALVAACAVAGLILGSFANVVIWRVPRGESIVSPASACPRCGHRLRWWENIPVVSFAILRGRCARCRERIPWRYPAVELATAALFAATALWRGPSPDLAAYLLLGFVAVVLAAIDAAHHRLPNAIVLPAIPALVALLVPALATGVGEAGDLLRALAGGAALGAFYGAIALVSPRGMGMGDVKLAGLLGIALGWIGWDALIVGAFAAFVLGAAAGTVIALVRGTGRRTVIPFGPWMLVGAAVGLVAGPALVAAYLAAMGIA